MFRPLAPGGSSVRQIAIVSAGPRPTTIVVVEGTVPLKRPAAAAAGNWQQG